MPRPNLLFVFADQLRAREIDSPAHPLITPAYDRLREEGTRCVEAVANCPVCTPSRGMLLTGQYPWRNRVLVNDLPLPDDAVTIGELLKGAGYRTGYVGKWHLDGVPRTRFTPPGPRRHGFDHWRVYNCTHNYYGSFYYGDEPEPVPIAGYEPTGQTDLAVEFLAAQSAEEPWSLFVSWGPPHDPYHLVPPWFERLYDPAAIDLPANVRPPDLSLVAPGFGPHAVGAHLDQRQAIARYYAAVSALDHELMRLLAALDRSGQAENTIVVYTSDHGDMLWSHGRVNKQQPWDESVRIPFVIRWPEGLEAGVDRRGHLGIVDMAPTLLSLMGVEPDSNMQGVDRSAMLRGGPGPTSAFIFDLWPVDQGLAQSVPVWRGVRTSRHTYAQRLDGTPWLLYDHAADPDQLTNLLGVPGHEGLRAELAAELARWQAVAGDEGVDCFELLRRYGLVELWNARERELHGDRGRFLEVS